MHVPLIPSELLSDLQPGAILAVERTQPEPRNTPGHAHQCGQLIGARRGVVSVTTAEAVWVLGSSHALWAPPHTRHALNSHGAYSGWSVYISPEDSRGLPKTPRRLEPTRLLREAVSRAATWRRPSELAAERRLAAVILDEVAAAPDAPLGLIHPRDARARRVTEALLAAPEDGRGLDAWAAWAAISPRTLARRLADETGLSFSDWRQRARAFRAVELLSDGLPVTAVAIDMGYANVSAFIAMFRRTMGATPGRYLRAWDAPQGETDDAQ